MTSDEFVELLAKIERERGFQGTQYRQRCLLRRLAVRMRARGVDTAGEYARLLDVDPAEYERLLRVLTINVSKFFRNPETWAVIREQVLPQLLRLERRPLVAWSAGVAAGEEIYSLAILFYELLSNGRSERLDAVRLIGTDIDGVALAQAKTASYPEVALAETPPEIRSQWFSGEGPYTLKAPIPSLVEFMNLDVLAERPRFDADLIVCRNLLIYLDRRAQEEVFRMFVEVLRPGGFLVLGRVESLGRPVRKKFDTVDARERVFRKR